MEYILIFNPKLRNDGGFTLGFGIGTPLWLRIMTNLFEYECD